MDDNIAADFCQALGKSFAQPDSAAGYERVPSSKIVHLSHKPIVQHSALLALCRSPV
jgi:hypothetical protein